MVHRCTPDFKPVCLPPLPFKLKGGETCGISTQHFAVATMLKTNFLVLCALISMTTCIVFLFYNKSLNLSYSHKADFTSNATDSISELFKQDLDKMLEERVKLLTAKKSNKTLEPCPDDPPNLIGPFLVEFNVNRSWNEVRRKISSPLQDGGRHKPPNCVSKHKVREWI